MKKLNKYLSVLSVLSVFAIELSAQGYSYSKDYLERAEKNSIVSMDSELNSLVESVIFNMLIFKDNFPNWEYDRIVGKLNELAVNGRTISIRYKAQLASMFISNPELFEDINIVEKDNPNKYFLEIASRVERKFVASNN